MPAHQIWSCHVTQDAHFTNFLFYPTSTFNIKKVTKFPVEKLFTSEVISKVPHGGGKHLPPVPLGLILIYGASEKKLFLVP